MSILLLGCGAGLPPSPIAGFNLHIYNVDGPPVAISINGRLAADLSCQSDVTLEPGRADVSALPWDVTIKTQNGHPAGEWSVDGSYAPVVFVRWDGAFFGVQPGNPGVPAATACPTVDFIPDPS